MQTVQQIVPISDMKLKHGAVLSLLKKGPVVLAQRSRPAAVLVSVKEWDETAQELARLRRLRLDMLERRSLEMQAGDYIDLDDLDKELAVH